MSSDPDAGNIFSRIKNKLNPPKKQRQNSLRQDIAAAYRKKQIDETEESMLEGILDFSAEVAREVMVPRTDAFMIDINDDFQKNLDEILRQPYSRIPVYDQDRDKIVGVIHIRSILRQARKKGFANLTYKDVMAKPLFAAETTELSDLLLQMQDTQKQIAILTDEFGGVTGIATIEDLVEEIVGDIDDEVDESEVLIRKIATDRYLVYGKMPLSDFNDYFGLNLKMEDVGTVAGYVIAKLGLIPAKGEKLKVDLPDGSSLVTNRMKGSRLISLTMIKAKSEAAKDSNE